MKRRTLTIVLVLLLVLLVIGVAQLFFSSEPDLSIPSLKPRKPYIPEDVASLPSATPVNREVAVDIIFGGGKKTSGVVSATNAFEALKKIADDKGIAFETKQFKYGLMVTKIGDKENSQTHFWVYSVNGKPGQIAADRKAVYPEDKVVWEYKKN